tara:strand:- start:314 stop:421 length:108 start_codon:yes stop_codon:yes gene_type:complete
VGGLEGLILLLLLVALEMETLEGQVVEVQDVMDLE